jgi:hypothetical protein
MTRHGPENHMQSSGMQTMTVDVQSPTTGERLA